MPEVGSTNLEMAITQRGDELEASLRVFELWILG